MVEDVPVAGEKGELLQLRGGHVKRVEIVKPTSPTMFQVELDC